MLSALRRCLKSERLDADIFDIVFYGSAARGARNPHDVDIVVIFRIGSLRERLQKVQLLKKKIKIPGVFDIKGILFDELFHPDFFARSGIFLDGVSIFDGLPFSTKIGFEGAVLFFYQLKEKSHTAKVKFNYVLRGRQGKGIIALLGAVRIAPGVIRVTTSRSSEFEDVLRLHEVSYSSLSVLIRL